MQYTLKKDQIPLCAGNCPPSIIEHYHNYFLEKVSAENNHTTVIKMIFCEVVPRRT